MQASHPRHLIGCLLLAFLSSRGANSWAAEGELQPDVRVRDETQLDWTFAAGADAERVAHGYDSRRQHYQLFVPAEYKADRTWPLVVFLAPGDDPLGWDAWAKTCRDSGLLFCAPYGVGDGTASGRRIRATLDVLDDVRRRYHIDPDRTYLAGLGSGARLACRIGLTLPEHFGGVVAVGGGGEIPSLSHLRRRARARLSFALVVGETDFARPEIEDSFAPLLRELDVHSRLWVVPDAGHALPPDDVTRTVVAWLDEDQKRRQDDTRALPGLSGSADEVISRARLAVSAVDHADSLLRTRERIGEAADWLEWAAVRCASTEGADRARKVLEGLRSDPRRGALLAEQSGREELRWTTARGKVLEANGRVSEARPVWEELARTRPGTPEAAKAHTEVTRLTERLANLPYLGAVVEGDGRTLRSVVERGPAQGGGLRVGDVLVRVDGQRVTFAGDLRRILATHRGGNRIDVVVLRDGKRVTMVVELGKRPATAE
jgi:pimeloyl-ACP methyl ester carboxylesterase